MPALARAERDKAHIQLQGQQRGQSIQHRIKDSLRQSGERLRDLFKKVDVDKSGFIDRDEFSQALRSLKVAGGIEDYYSLFDAWDTDGCGSLQYTEILAALSGHRYDAFDDVDADIERARAFTRRPQRHFSKRRTLRLLMRDVWRTPRRNVNERGLLAVGGLRSTR